MMVGTMAVPLTSAQLALVTLLARCFPTPQRAAALLGDRLGEVPEGLRGEALWIWWLLGSTDEPRPRSQTEERIELVRLGVARPELELGEDERRELLERIRDVTEVAKGMPLQGPQAHPVPEAGGMAEQVQPLRAMPMAARSRRLIGFPVVLVAVAVGLVLYVAWLLGGL